MAGVRAIKPSQILRKWNGNLFEICFSCFAFVFAFKEKNTTTTKQGLTQGQVSRIGLDQLSSKNKKIIKMKKESIWKKFSRHVAGICKKWPQSPSQPSFDGFFACGLTYPPR